MLSSKLMFLETASLPGWVRRLDSGHGPPRPAIAMECEVDDQLEDPQVGGAAKSLPIQDESYPPTGDRVLRTHPNPNGRARN